MSCLYISANTLLVGYFVKWKTIAFTIMTSGVAFGTLILPLYIKWAIDSFGWRGGYLLSAGKVNRNFSKNVNC